MCILYLLWHFFGDVPNFELFIDSSCCKDVAKYDCLVYLYVIHV